MSFLSSFIDKDKGNEWSPCQRFQLLRNQFRSASIVSSPSPPKSHSPPLPLVPEMRRREERLEKEETEENARRAEKEYETEDEEDEIEDEEDECQIVDQETRTASPTTVQSLANQVGSNSRRVHWTKN